MKTHIVFKTKIPGLNSKDGLMRESPTQAKERVISLHWEILSLTRNKHLGKVVITWHRFSNKLMDWDNHAASFKNVGDALVMAGTIIDDNPDVVIKFIIEQTKVRTRPLVRCEVTIEDYVK